MTPCPKCHSDKIIPDVLIEDRGMGNIPASLSVRVDEKPDALVLKGRRTGELRAQICGQCGFTELYVSNPQQLYEAQSSALARTSR